MRHRNKISIFMSMVWFFLFLPGLSADSEVPFEENEKQVTISMDLQDVRLKEVLKILSIQSGLNFVASQALQDRTMTLYLEKVPLKQAMDKIFEANNLSYELDKKANVFIVKDWGAPRAEMQTRVYYLKNQAVSTSSLGKEMGGADTIAGIKSVLSPQGKVFEDARTNSFVITDEPGRFVMIEEVLAGLDIPQPQVMLELEILDVTKGATEKLGIKWPETLMNLSVPGARMTSFPFTGNKGDSNQYVWGKDLKTPTDAYSQYYEYGNGLSAMHFPASVFTMIGSNLALNFLRSQTDTKVLARPKIRTMNNQTAEIKIATDEAVTVTPSSASVGTTGSTAGFTVERSTTGITLKVTPMINVEKGEITMSILPKETASTASSLSTSQYQVKDTEERSIKSVVKVKDGETIIMGGLIRKQLEQTETKMPILGDIPLFGSLFRHKNKSTDRERELLVFITPRILNDSAVKLTQGKPVVIPEREQDIAFGVTRQVAISNYLNNLDKKAR